MKVKLLRDTKPFGRTGEIVEVSPAHFDWLVSLGFAVPVKEAREQAETPVKAEAPAEKPGPKAVKKTAKKK
jgi:ribosomal protein L9